MKLNDHIANRFLTDEDFILEIVEAEHGNLEEIMNQGSEEKKSQVAMLYDFLKADSQVAYIVRQSIMNNLSYIKVGKKEVADGKTFDWFIFNNIPDTKNTYVLPDNRLIRFQKKNGMLQFVLLEFEKTNGIRGNLQWHTFWVDLKEKRHCSHLFNENQEENVKLIYKFLCFFFLSEIELKTLKPNEKVGSRKEGKYINNTKETFTIVDTNWNVCSVRTEGFLVSGHFAIRRCGRQRNDKKLVWIQPYKKNGYIRKAKKEQVL